MSHALFTWCISCVGFRLVATSDSEMEREWSEVTSLSFGSSSWEDSFSSDEEFFGELDYEFVIVLEVALVANYTHEFFNASGLNEGGQALVNLDVSVRDRLLGIGASHLMFKTLTNFTLDEFYDLCLDVCLTIISCVGIMAEVNTHVGRFYNLVTSNVFWLFSSS